MGIDLEAGLSRACALIATDMWGRRLLASQRRMAAEFAFSRAEGMAAKLAATHGMDLAEVSRRLGVEVEMSEEARQEAGSVILSECLPAHGNRRPLIRVYLGSFPDDPGKSRLALAHELFHYLESVDGRTGQLFIRQQQLGWQWRWRRLRVLSEVAAHRFAESLTGDTVDG